MKGRPSLPTVSGRRLGRNRHEPVPAPLVQVTIFVRSPTQNPEASSGCVSNSVKRQPAVSIRTDRQIKRAGIDGAKRRQVMPAAAGHAGAVVHIYVVGCG